MGRDCCGSINSWNQLCSIRSRFVLSKLESSTYRHIHLCPAVASVHVVFFLCRQHQEGSEKWTLIGASMAHSNLWTWGSKWVGCFERWGKIAIRGCGAAVTRFAIYCISCHLTISIKFSCFNLLGSNAALNVIFVQVETVKILSSSVVRKLLLIVIHFSMLYGLSVVIVRYRNMTFKFKMFFYIS